MKTIKCIAIDDNLSALNIIETLSRKVDFIKIQEKFSDPIKAGNYLQNNKDIDLIFLDVQMPDMDGLTFLKTYKPKQPIIFISKHKEYAVDSYDLENSLNINVIDFLPIPVTIERFIRACNKALEEVSAKDQFIFLSENSIKFKIPYDDIVLIEADDEDAKYMNFYFKNPSSSIKDSKNPKLFRITLTDLEQILPQEKFMRISKSSIIHYNSIIRVKGDEIFTDLDEKKTVQIGDKWKNKVEAFIDKYKRK